jgi:glycolate oxidase iron-sulfur subunit
MKQVLEGKPATAKTRLHLDRCLTCRACETTCPSGVQYGRLLDIGRPIVEEQVSRGGLESLQRKALRAVVPNPALFAPLLKLGQLVRPLLPAALKHMVPPAAAVAKPWPHGSHARKMLVLEGCAQPGLSPATNAAAARVLDRLGITLIRAANAGCCGAVSLHLSAQDEALGHMRRNIDAWWPYIEHGAQAIVMTASGCGVTVKDYGYLLAHDPAYADKAEHISSLTRDVSEIIAAEKDKISALLASRTATPSRVAFHPPCSLQHGLKMKGQVEALLAGLGFDLVPVADAHLCCGSAGTYSVLQPELSQRLLANKIKALSDGAPSAILTANIGCQSHLQTATHLTVRHWIEAIDDMLDSF